MAFARVNVEFFTRPPNICGSIKSSSTQTFSAFSHSRAQNCNVTQEYRRSALVIAVFNIMRTLKFKPQPMVYVFRCRQSSKRISGKKKLTSAGSKGHFCLVVISRFRSILFFSVFQGSLAVAIILIDGREKNPVVRVRMLLKTAVNCGRRSSNGNTCYAGFSCG